MEHSKPLVIVLSRNYSTGLGVIRSLGQAGYPVDLVASTKKKGSSVIASCSRYVRRSQEVLAPKIQGDTGAGLVDVLLEYAAQPGTKVIFPTDDFTASVVASYHDVLKPHFLMPEIRADRTLIETMDKTLQGQLAREAGLLTPREWVISLREDIVVPEDVVYPCFVKPLQSISGHKTEMAVCGSPEELSDHLAKMQSFFDQRSVLVQEYLHIDREYDLSGLCLDQTVIIPAVIEKTHIARFEKGVTMAGRLLAPEIMGELLAKMKDLLRRLRYVGMFDMELHVCGDKIYFNEINLRSGGPNFAYCLGGVNLPAMLVEELLGLGHDPAAEEMTGLGKSFVYEKVAWEDYIHGYMTRQELRACLEEADFSLLANEDDPAPGRRFARRIRLSAAKHHLWQLLGREKRSKNQGVGERPRVIVAGRNFCNILTMTRALGEAGYDVEVLRVYKKKPHPLHLLQRMKPDARSQYVRRFTECIVHSGPEDVVQQLLGMADAAVQKLLIPVDDYVACVVDDALDSLRTHFIVPNIRDTAGAITRLMDKNTQKELAAQFDLPLLQSCLIKSENGAFTIPAQTHYPCFIKPNISMNSTKAKMRRCDSEEELRAVLSGYAAQGDFEMLVEEFADIRAEYSVLGVSTPAGTVAPGLFRVLEGGHRERKGVAITGQTVPCAQMQSVLDATVRFIDALAYTGLFDVDLIETTDGKVYFIELNFRAGASTHVFTETGVNLPGMFADHLLRGMPIDLHCRVEKTGQRFVSEKVLMEEFARSDISWKKVKEHMAEADVCFIRDEKDPGPYRYFKKFYVVAALMRLPYRVRDYRKNK